MMTMSSQLIAVAVPLAILCGLAGLFLSIAIQAASTDRERHRRARNLTQTPIDAILGSVGWSQADGLGSDFDCGMVSREQDGKVIVARQARLTQDAIASL
jgi:NADH:ubiquinone oxidoreductase subunit 3 (subunit A)